MENWVWFNMIEFGKWRSAVKFYIWVFSQSHVVWMNYSQVCMWNVRTKDGVVEEEMFDVMAGS